MKLSQIPADVLLGDTNRVPSESPGLGTREVKLQLSSSFIFTQLVQNATKQGSVNDVSVVLTSLLFLEATNNMHVIKICIFLKS